MAAGMSRPTPGNRNVGMVMLILKCEIYVVVEVCWDRDTFKWPLLMAETKCTRQKMSVVS